MKPQTTDTINKNDKKLINKYIYMDFVLLNDDEYQKLVKRFGEEGTQERIERLNNYIGSKGDKYKSHYHTILVWERGNGKGGQTNNGKTSSKQHDKYSGFGGRNYHEETFEV